MMSIIIGYLMKDDEPYQDGTIILERRGLVNSENNPTGGDFLTGILQ